VNPEVLYLDNHLLVIIKPAGMLSQADRTRDPDVVTWAKVYLKERFAKPGNVFAGLVHRLDRPASGVMVLARTSKAAARLGKAFAGRAVTKQYLALVEGVPDPQGLAEDHLVKQERKVRVVSADHPGGKFAALEWRVLVSKGNRSLVEVLLKTGRPHQVRVQMSSRGWPIVGDFRYGSSREFDGQNLALHAWRLALEHPTKKEPLSWTAELPPQWPEWCRDAVASQAC
jgi:23S rRNA pseudouridine1911/1915/1917 synthase